MSLTDFGNLMKQAQQIQEGLAQAQQKIERLTVEGSAGGGMVRAVVNGKHELLTLTIDPTVFKEDVELLQDLVIAAVNEAIRNAQKMATEEMTKITGGIKIPGLG